MFWEAFAIPLNFFPNVFFSLLIFLSLALSLLLFISLHFAFFVARVELFTAMTLMYEKVLSYDQHNWNRTPFKIRIIAISKGHKRRQNNNEDFDIFVESFVWFVHKISPILWMHSQDKQMLWTNTPLEKLIFEQLLLNMLGHNSCANVFTFNSTLLNHILFASASVGFAYQMVCVCVFFLVHSLLPFLLIMLRHHGQQTQWQRQMPYWWQHTITAQRAFMSKTCNIVKYFWDFPPLLTVFGSLTDFSRFIFFHVFQIFFPLSLFIFPFVGFVASKMVKTKRKLN